MKKLRKILRVISSKKRAKLTKVGLVKILKKSDCPFTVAFSDHPRNLVQSDAFLACDGPNRVAVSANRFSTPGKYRVSQRGHPVMTWVGSITDLCGGIMTQTNHKNGYEALLSFVRENVVEEFQPNSMDTIFNRRLFKSVAEIIVKQPIPPRMRHY